MADDLTRIMASAGADTGSSAAQASEPLPQSGRARSRLTRRLADIVCLPETRVSPQERWMTADVLDELLRRADTDLRAKVAARLAEQAEAPPGLIRRLALDAMSVAEPILSKSQALTDFDMMEIASKGERGHQMALARRDHVSETVAATLVANRDPDVIEVLLKNPGARLAGQTVDYLVREWREADPIARLIIKRPETRPSQAFALFWSVSNALRRKILERFSVSRAILQDAAADVFPIVAREVVPDPDVAEALVYIDRRQRDRDAAERSIYGNLERAVESYARAPGDTALQAEIASLSNIRGDLAERILTDIGGEPVAILVKATGLTRPYLALLAGTPDDSVVGGRANNAQHVYDTLSVDKAQTVLRYWNWVFARGRAD